MALFSSSGTRYLGLGIEMAGAVGALILAGWWVDRHFGTGPWGILTGALVGLVGGMTYLIREAFGAVRAGARQEGGERWDGSSRDAGSSKDVGASKDAGP